MCEMAPAPVQLHCVHQGRAHESTVSAGIGGAGNDSASHFPFLLASAQQALVSVTLDCAGSSSRVAAGRERRRVRCVCIVAAALCPRAPCAFAHTHSARTRHSSEYACADPANALKSALACAQTRPPARGRSARRL